MIKRNEKVYTIHDNGNEPFKVKILKDTHTIKIFELSDSKQNIYKLFKTIKSYQNIFIGKDPMYKNYTGNSILIELLDNLYMYIGSEIYTFKTDEKITKYFSPVGNSDVPYPYAISKNYVYLMIEYIYYDKKLAFDQDFYGVYYGHIKKVPKIDKNNVFKMNIKKLIHARIM